METEHCMGPTGEGGLGGILHAQKSTQGGFASKKDQLEHGFLWATSPTSSLQGIRTTLTTSLKAAVVC